MHGGASTEPRREVTPHPQNRIRDLPRHDPIRLLRRMQLIIPHETIPVCPIRDRARARVRRALVELVYAGLDGAGGVEGRGAVEVGRGVIEDGGEEGVGVKEACSIRAWSARDAVKRRDDKPM